VPDKPTAFTDARKKPAQRQGGSAALRDHSRAYHALCARLMAAEPLCRYCAVRGHITAARVIDHIVALSLNGSNDETNLAPACQPCNAAKAIVEQRFAAKGYDRDDVMLDHDLAAWIRLARQSASKSAAPPPA